MPQQSELITQLNPRRAKHPPLFEPPRERLVDAGSHSLSLRELIAVVIGTGMASDNAMFVAEFLLYEFGSLESIALAPVKELASTDGLTELKAIQLKASMEIGRRLLKPKSKELIQVTCPADAANFLMPDMMHLEQEHVRVLLLNTRNEIVDSPTLYVGSINTATVRVCEVFKDAIRQNAKSLVFSHNHPSGDPFPSPEDRQLTRALIDAGELLGITVIDHVIIGRGSYFSLKESGIVFNTV